MPRRSAIHSTPDAAHVQPTSLPLPSSSTDALSALRTNWKWAAFSQFFFTFSPLFAMNDVSLNDIEEDLVFGRCIFIPRVMQRLLFVLTYDRKVSLDNWQTILRKQYNKRDPLANPIGPEPVSELQEESATDDYATPDPSDGITADTDDVAGSTRASPVDNSNSADNIPAPLLAKKYHYLVNEAQAAELDQRASKSWLDLSMLEKLDSMYLLTEWQFHNPTRVRTMMKTDDDTATWRIEPIGYDAKRNAYWLIGADRLWIQREPPRPPKSSKSLKRKRTDIHTKFGHSSASTKRQRIHNDRLPAAKGKDKAKATETPIVERSSRAAKAQAKIKLDAQAKELAELNRQAALLQHSSSRSSSRQKKSRANAAPAPATRQLTTRLSMRSRGMDDDEWQTIPDEWLEATTDDDQSPNASDPRQTLKTGLESDNDSVSDLTELSEDSEARADDTNDDSSAISTDQEDQPPEPDKQSAEERIAPSGDFVEWETICATLQEWEHIAERWRNASHYAEKALYRVLTKTIVPIITEELRELERKRRMEEAVVHRKRSSRIAVKEHAKEEARQAARRKAEEDERMGRARRAEARQMKEEAERLRREQAREQRRLEEEAEETKEARHAENKENESESIHVDVVGDSVDQVPQQSSHTLLNNLNGNSTSGSRTPNSDWELDCEICHRTGTNVDDGVPIMCCEGCSKWQHISCHDRADQQAGRPKRNWDKVDFVCRQCRLRKAALGHREPRQENPSISLRIPPAPSLNPNFINQIPYGVSLPHSSKSISFSHYRPQLHGFSASGHATQPYIQASQHPQYQGIPDAQIPHSHHVAPTNGWNGVGFASNNHWPPPQQSPADHHASSQFKYHPTSYQARS